MPLRTPNRSPNAASNRPAAKSRGRIWLSLVLAALLPATAAAQTGASRTPSPPADCPVALTLPSGWTRLPLGRGNPERSIRLDYGKGAENYVLVNVRLAGSKMADMERRGVVTNALMSEQPAIVVAGKTVPLQRSTRFEDAVNGRGGSDVWRFLMPFDDEQTLIVDVVAMAGKGVTPPAPPVLLALMKSMVPGACLADDDEP
jgi:hypothetical protein